MPDLMGTPATYQLTVDKILNLIPPKPPIWGAATHMLTHIFFLANNSILYSKIPESRNKESN